ncbi:MAG: hypothetical protein E7413_06720 [Ruminococcaceae bacterium]|nr:hypothetical protein [Oscillospiraceae bacterium]
MFQIADLVVSLSGRDKNRIFMVLEVLDSNYVLLADGMLRKLEKPKKKKVKHLEKSQYTLNERLLQKISEGKKITNAELRKSLRALTDDTESEE